MQTLGLQREKHTMAIHTVGNAAQTHSFGAVELFLLPKGHPSISVSAAVLPRVTCDLPTEAVLASDWPMIDHLLLADPRFHDPGRVDMILGADVYDRIVLDSKLFRFREVFRLWLANFW